MDIGSRLREFAKWYGSATKLAAALQMKPPALQSYITNRSKPGASILIALTNLGCNIVWLLTGKGEMLGGSDSYSASGNPDVLHKLRTELRKKDNEIQRLKGKVEALEDIILKIDKKGADLQLGTHTLPRQPKQEKVLQPVMDK